MTPLHQQITDLWGQITAATHRFLELVAEFDDRGGWNDLGGIMSCAHWLNIYCGIGMVAAREKVRVAHAIRGLPAINDAFRDGRVSYSKVRAMTRVATPENEHVLLNFALHGTAAHVERTVRYYRKVERLEGAARAAAAHRDRYLQFRYESEEQQAIHAVLPIEVAELVRQALDRAVELLEPAPGDSAESWGARRADALHLIASQFLEQRVLCELEDGPTLAIETARRLACDGALVGLVDDAEGQPLNVGRRTRAIPPSLKRALRARDKGCRFPGCPHTRYTQGHHVRHWADGGETRLSNLITLCHHHHHLVHESGYRIEITHDGVFRFLDPAGEPVNEDFAVSGRFRGIAIAQFNRERGIHIGPDTVVTRWQGERMDYSIAMDCMLEARERAANPDAFRGEGWRASESL